MQRVLKSFGFTSTMEQHESDLSKQWGYGGLDDSFDGESLYKQAIMNNTVLC